MTPSVQNPELAAVEVHGMTRASFILKGALATGAALGTAAVSPFVADALGAGMSDVDVLNFALTLEYLETDFYLQKAKAVGLSGEARSVAAMFGEQENEHVQALMGAIKKLGGTPAKKPTFAFPVSSQASFLSLAYKVENLGVGAYNGAGPMLTNPQLLAAAGSIVQVEARHAAVIGLLTGQSVTPNGAFDKGLSKSQVLSVAGPLIK